MIIDSSAILAIFKRETGFERFIEALTSTSKGLSISAATLLETSIVVEHRKDAKLRQQIDEFVSNYAVEIIPFTPSQLLIAVEAHRTYGRGSGHPARLNFGDCFAYALAKETGEPLLFKGNDFAQTDIQPALS